MSEEKELKVKITPAEGGYIVKDGDYSEQRSHIATSREGVAKVVLGLCNETFGSQRGVQSVIKTNAECSGTLPPGDGDE